MPGGRSKGRGKRRGGSSSGVNRSIVNSAKATGSTSNVVATDLSLRRQNFNIVQRPPKSLGNQIFWTKLSLDFTNNISNSTVLESNIAFNASSFNGFSSGAAFFDQYCIYGVVVTFTSLSASLYTIRVMTAIDYDSISNIGVSGIQGFSSFNEASLGGNGADSYVRFIMPCIAPQVTNSSNLPVAAGIGRSWIDAAYSAINHYGLRVVYPVASTTMTAAVNITCTAIFGWRNSQ